MTPFARTPWPMAAYLFCAGLVLGFAVAELDGARDWRVVAICAALALLNGVAAYVWRPMRARAR